VGDPPESKPPEIPIERVRAVLERAVTRVCPRWPAEEREDLVQNAALRVLRIARESKEERSFLASYLWKVAHSAVMDEIRRRRGSRENPVRDPGAGAAAPDPSPESQGTAADIRRAMNDGLRSLSEPRRWAVLLYLHGFSLQDSARALGWNTKKVDNMRYQGLAELRRHLKERGFAP
jgi:RNA polymerase sigma factor (sigma-70 family)